MHSKTVGSRAEVFHGNAHHTSGGLTKNDLMKNKHGEIVSKKKHFQAKKDKRFQNTANHLHPSDGKPQLRI